MNLTIQVHSICFSGMSHLFYWNVASENCWSKCGDKGGVCSYCDNGTLKGFCCRKDGVGGNNDCPLSAITSIPEDRNYYHVCVSQRNDNHSQGNQFDFFSKSIKS